MNLRISFNKTVATITMAIFAVALFAMAQTASAAISSVTVTAPNGGEAWNATQSITWICTDDGVSPKCSDTTVNDILYSPDGGTTWEGVGYTGSSITASVGTWSWDTTAIPNTESANGLIKVVVNSPAINDESDAAFTVDNTKPTISSATTNDSDGNGKVDQLIVVFDETMDNSITSTTGFTYGSYTLGANGTWSTTTNTDDTFTIPVTENANTCDFTDQTGCDTDDTSNVAYTPGTLADPATNIANAYASAPATDGAKPAIVGSKTDDADSNGQIDTMYVQFSEDIDGGALGAGDFTVNGHTPITTAIEAPAGFVTLAMPESGTPDTDATPLMAISSGQSVKDLPGNELTQADPGSHSTPADGAAPVAIKTEYFNDPSALSSVDRFRVYFSEDISITPHGSFGNIEAGTAITSSGALTGFTNPNAIGGVGDGDDNVFFTTAGATTNQTGANGGSEPTWSYTYNTTDTLQDAAGNLWTAIASGATTMVDAAAPVVIDTATVDRGTSPDGIVDTLELQFSEYMDDATFTSNAVADWALSSDGANTWENFDQFSEQVDVLAVDHDSYDDYAKLYFNSVPSVVSGTHKMHYKYTNDGGDDIKDPAGNKLADISAVYANDKAKPQIKELQYLDGNGDGKIDSVKLLFSEYVTASSFLSANDLVFTSVGDFTNMAFGSNATDLLTVGGSDVTIPLGTPATPVDTRDDTVSITFDTQNSFSLQDSASNINNTLISQVHAEIVDKAAPVLLTADPLTKTTGDGSGNTAIMTLVYSEDVTTSSTTGSDYTVKVAPNGAEITVSSVTVPNGPANPTNNKIIGLSLDSSDVDQTTAPLDITYVAGVVKDWMNNQAVAQTNTAITDGAQPVLTAFSAVANPAGIGDSVNVTLTFSEDMETGAHTLTGSGTLGFPSLFGVAGHEIAATSPAATNYFTGNKWTGTYFDSTHGATAHIESGTPASGTYTFHSNNDAQDTSGNVMHILSGLVMDVVVDSTYPQTTGLEVTPAAAGMNIPVVITATVNDDVAPNGAELYIEVGGSAVDLGAMTEDQISNGGKTKTYKKTIVPSAIPGVAGGNTYNVYVVGKDTVNDEPLDKDSNGSNDILTETLSVSSDTTAPVITLDGAGTTVNIDADTYNITGNVTDSNYKLVKVFRMVGGSPSGTNDVEVGTFTFGPTEGHWEVLVNLPQGVQTKYYAEAYDLSNNGVQSGILTVDESATATDTTAPTLTSTAPSIEQTVGSVSDVVFTFTDDTAFDATAGNNVVSFTMDGSDVKASANTSINLSGTTLTVTYSDSSMSAGVHNFNITVKDAVGNEKDASLTVHVVNPNDTTAPTIALTSPAVTAITQTGASINFTSDEAGEAKVSYGTTSSYGNVTTWQTMSNGNNGITLGGLACGTTYNFQVAARDASGNLATPTSNATFTTSACLDTTAPDFTSSFANVVSAGFDVVTSADESFDVKIEVDTDSNFGSIDQTVAYSAAYAAGPLSKTVSGLTSDTLYYVRVSVKDSAGNERVKVYTQQTAQGGAINLTGLSVSAVADTSAQIDWATDATPASGDYRVAITPYSGTWTAMTIGGASGSQALSGLTANTTYYYQVRFVKNGQTSYSIPMSFTTAASSTGLSVDSIQAIKSYAVADDTYANGWKWKFNITLNNLTETNLAMKFDQWVSGTNTLDAANNMRYSVDDATWTAITANGAYPATNIDVSAIDEDASKGGRQVTVYVEMKVPVGTTSGSYSTSYGVRSL